MNLFKFKLAGVLAMSMAMLGAGPAWSAASTSAQVESKAKQVVKAKKSSVNTVKANKATTAKAEKAVKSPAVLTAVPVVAGAATVAPLAVAVVAPAPAPASAPVSAATKPAEAAAVPAPAPATASGYTGNPYLAYRQYVAPAVSAAPVAPAAAPAVSAAPAARAAPAATSVANDTGGLLDSIKSLLPSIPDGQSILPSIKTVYPTGEKPLVVLTFKCPTELIGITPLPTKLLHDGVNGVFDIVNATDLLSFNMQQVCQ